MSELVVKHLKDRGIGELRIANRSAFSNRTRVFLVPQCFRFTGLAVTS